MNDGSCRHWETNDGCRLRPAAFRDTSSAQTLARLSCVTSRHVTSRGPATCSGEDVMFGFSSKGANERLEKQI